MSKILSGSELKKTIMAEITEEILRLQKRDITVGLAVIVVGNDPASAVYVGSKEKTCAEIGIESRVIRLPEETTQDELLDKVEELNQDPRIHGILCQVPLPEHCDEDQVIRTIVPTKDVDCFHPYNVGLLATGSPRFMPCTPYGILQILKRNQIETAGKEVVVIGRSNIVGRPLSILVSQKGWDATVTVCHSRTKDLPQVCSRADILIAAIGISRFVTADFVKEGAVVIDVGMNRIEDKTHPKGKRLTGDVDFEAVKDKCSYITPVPGGVGPMTIAMLMLNTVNAARLHNGLPLFAI